MYGQQKPHLLDEEKGKDLFNTDFLLLLASYLMIRMIKVVTFCLLNMSPHLHGSSS